jgi:hypothetical protein
MGSIYKKAAATSNQGLKVEDVDLPLAMNVDISQALKQLSSAISSEHSGDGREADAQPSATLEEHIDQVELQLPNNDVLDRILQEADDTEAQPHDESLVRTNIQFRASRTLGTEVNSNSNFMTTKFSYQDEENLADMLRMQLHQGSQMTPISNTKEE